MYKFLIIVGLVVYVLYKIGSWFFRAGAASQQMKNQQPGGTFNRNMNSQPQQKKKGTDFKGGEYIDYEEIK
jgi:hypothetical protein